MASKPVPLTKPGLAKLQQELDHLVNVRRAEVAQRIHDANRDLLGDDPNSLSVGMVLKIPQ